MEAHEPALEPSRPIIDPHLHLWDIGPLPVAIAEAQTFLMPEAAATLEQCGHTVTHTVFVECGTMHRASGPAELRSLGETEFANGTAAMAASGRYGPALISHRIVGNVGLLLGIDVERVLEAHLAAAGERFVGVRNVTAFSQAGLFGAPCDPSREGIMQTPRFRDAARILAARGLSLDVWCLQRQLPEVIALADAVPDLTIILDHAGTPEARRSGEAFSMWRKHIGELAQRPNVRVKLGGLGMDLGVPIAARAGPLTSAALANLWRPYLDACIEAFGHHRAMFESNFPPDQAAGSYGATWNAFKIVAAACSEDEKDWLFRRTAAATYRIELPG